MGYFPFYIDIENKNCLVVGGGTVALRKVEKLVPFKPKITVVAPEISDEIRKFEGIRIHKRGFCDGDLDGVFLVISAADDRELNAHIYELCTERKILVNTVDDKEKCGFIFPALVKRENVTVGISTEGKSPIYARFLREKIEGSLDESCDEAIEILSSVRESVKREIDSEEKRKLAFERILGLCIADIESVTSDKILDILNTCR